MNKLKKIYYPILIVLFVAALVLGLVSAHVSMAGTKADQTFADSVRAHMTDFMSSVHNSYEPDNQETLRNHIVDTLKGNGISNGGGTKSEDYATAAADGEMSYVLQDVTLNADTMSELGSDDELVFAVRNLYNIVVIAPGQSEDAVLFMANYDSAARSQSGLESMEAAAMLQKVVDLSKTYATRKPVNTLVFVFTDAENEGAYGAYAFKHQFKGFGDITTKIKLAVSFGAKGTGALSVEADKLSLSSIIGSASGLSDALEDIYEGVSDYDAFDVAKLNVFFGGDREYLDTPRDTVDKVTDSQIKTFGGALESLIETYGYGAIEGTSDADTFSSTDAVGTFSIFGIAVSYSALASYILGALIFALLAASIAVMIRCGRSASGILRGVLAQFVAFAATAGILFVCYFVLTLLLAGFGVIPINAITAIKYMNTGLFVSWLLLTFAASAGVFLVMRKVFKVKVTDVARGGALWIMVLGIIMSFAMPSASLVFALTALLEGICLILASVFSKSFRGKYNADIERLFLYTLPLILLTPAMVPVMMSAGYILPSIYLPLVFAVAALGMGVIAPYFGLLKAPLSNVAAKLPQHKVRVEKTVTETVEEQGKKGRKTTKTVTRKKVVSEKVAWKYRNRYGVAVLGVLAAFLVIMFAVCPTYNFTTNKVNTFAYRDALKDDAIVYVWSQQGSDGETEKLRIYDQVAYTYFGRIDGDYSWNASLQAYEKNFGGVSSEFLGTNTPFSVSKTEDNTLTFTPYGLATGSFIDIKLTNVADVDSVTLVTGDEITIENDGKDTITILLPYDNDDYGNFAIRFSTEGTVMVGVEFTQYISGERARLRMNSLDDYSSVVAGFGNEEFKDDISCGMIFSRKNTFSLSKGI